MDTVDWVAYLHFTLFARWCFILPKKKKKKERDVANAASHGFYCNMNLDANGLI